MTDEELRKEATSTVEWERTPMIDRPLFVLAYITGARPREKRIAELEVENKELIETLLCTDLNNEDTAHLIMEFVEFYIRKSKENKKVEK